MEVNLDKLNSIVNRANTNPYLQMLKTVMTKRKNKKKSSVRVKNFQKCYSRASPYELVMKSRVETPIRPIRVSTNMTPYLSPSSRRQHLSSAKSQRKIATSSSQEVMKSSSGSQKILHIDTRRILSKEIAFTPVLLKNNFSCGAKKSHKVKTGLKGIVTVRRTVNETIKIQRVESEEKKINISQSSFIPPSNSESKQSFVIQDKNNYEKCQKFLAQKGFFQKGLRPSYSNICSKTPVIQTQNTSFSPMRIQNDSVDEDAVEIATKNLKNMANAKDMRSDSPLDSHSCIHTSSQISISRNPSKSDLGTKKKKKIKKVDSKRNSPYFRVVKTKNKQIMSLLRKKTTQDTEQSSQRKSTKSTKFASFWSVKIHKKRKKELKPDKIYSEISEILKKNCATKYSLDSRDASPHFSSRSILNFLRNKKLKSSKPPKG
ncbi:unnamed protein product [Moneuplotes crassus]|uniref:Uncharacterized protein n=1 Tax=Euplotes crassus TaxID=5936 RepID=A0AAD1UEC6_EUPCR|nr:unnamed protein product [Moneuplotes crassus]